MNYKDANSSCWTALSPEKKKYELFLRQKELLSTFVGCYFTPVLYSVFQSLRETLKTLFRRI